jgi:hypothetical protein
MGKRGAGLGAGRERERGHSSTPYQNVTTVITEDGRLQGVKTILGSQSDLRSPGTGSRGSRPDALLCVE